MPKNNINSKSPKKRATAKKEVPLNNDSGAGSRGYAILNWLYGASIEYFVNWRRHIKEYTLVILLMLALRSCVGVVYRIPTPSMIPTFREGDTLLANRFYYGLKLPFTDGLSGFRLPAIREVEPGDLIIFRAPPEQLFYDVVLPLSEENKQLVTTINKESSFKRPLSAVGSGSKLHNYLGKVNYVVMDAVGDTVVLYLHETVWNKFKPQLLEFGAEVVSSNISLMNYQNSTYDGFLYEVLKTPLSGFSIMGQAILNLPFFLPYNAILSIFYPEKLKNGVLDIYPNRFVDNTKEFVKRVIAVGGDTVEIKQRVVYVNGKALRHLKEVRPDPYDNYFSIGTETMPNSVKYTKDGGVFEHPVRFGKDVLSPFLSFDKELWPFQPNSFASVNFRDDFGPITVPEGHYFAMGDNRDESQDSRFIGAVPHWAIKGTPMFIFFPFNRAGLVK